MDLLVSFLPFILIMGVFYFMLMRPQQRQAQEKQNMLSALQKGDAVITIGGLHGVVDEVDQTAKTVVLDCEGIYLTYALSAIATVKRPETTSPELVDEEGSAEEA